MAEVNNADSMYLAVLMEQAEAGSAAAEEAAAQAAAEAAAGRSCK